MKLEKQVTSLELSKKLKELGVPQESLFHWNLWHGQMDDFMYQIHYRKPVKRLDGVLSEDTCSAYTVAELLERLPAGTSLLKRTDISGKNPPRYYTEVVSIDESRPEYNKDWLDENPAESLAKMLVYLLENKLITPKTGEIISEVSE